MTRCIPEAGEKMKQYVRPWYRDHRNMRSRLTLLALVAMISCSSVTAADTVIENKDLRVTFRSDDGSLSIQRPSAKFAFVNGATFPQNVE